MMSSRSTVSNWYPQTFNLEVVFEIAFRACPNFSVEGDAILASEMMNKAASELLIAQKHDLLISGTKQWALTLAKAAQAVAKACGQRPAQSAIQLRIDPEKFRIMLQTAKEVRVSALGIANGTGLASTKRRHGDPLVDLWVRRMADVYELCFDRDAGTSTDKFGKAGGPAPRFIAEAATKLLADKSVVGQSPASLSVLHPLKDPKRVATNLRRQMRELSIAEN